MSGSGQSSGPRVFTRAATGLVREAGLLDALVYNVNFISIGLMVALMFLYMPSYGGVSLPLSLVLCALLALPTAATYGMLAAIMPRSGGDYVYVSRVLGPAWGMMSNWNTTVWWVLYGGVPSAFLASFGIAPLMRIIAAFTGNVAVLRFADWAASPTGMFVIGALLILILTGIFILGLGVYFRVQNVLFAFAMLATVLVVLVTLLRSPGVLQSSLAQHLAALAGRPDILEALLRESGYEVQSFNLRNTVITMTWIYLTMGFSFSSAYIGGEVKQASKIQVWVIPGTVIYALVWGLLLVWSVTRAVGEELIGAISTLGDAGAPNVGLAAAPRFHELVALGSGNLLLAFLIGFGFIFWSYAWLPGQILNASRNLVAYAIDGLMPSALAWVSPRFHTPVVSLVLMGGLSIVSLAIYVFTPYFATLVGIFGFLLTFIMVSLSAVLLPYRRPDLFAGSPVAWRIGGVPVLSIVGAISIVACLVMQWAYLNDPYSGISLDPSTLREGILGFGMFLLNVAIFLSGLVIYGIARWWRNRQGIDISLAYREIPVE
ncbi:APC family permease [Thermomicrobium sp. 4228-Ro]|uniref:APC family permease n=1 Tax=Thermomicrobium sp. 4228-Ro TaxID=2993937 RepID=UPI002249320B|nr:APC family permease [Thermomicrobium sp. 4228-Ro]MCX2727409.1 APC family permease [Thermomicrobium sp. 4228-Ro]